MTEPTTITRRTTSTTVPSTPDTASAPVSCPAHNRSSRPAYSDRRLLREQNYRVGRHRVTLRLWRMEPAVHPADPTRDHRPQYVLELSGGGTVSTAFLGHDHARAVDFCERMIRSGLSPVHLSDVLEDEGYLSDPLGETDR